MKRNFYGEIVFDDMKKAIELADNIDEVASLRDLLEEDCFECRMELSVMLSKKEQFYNL